MAITLRNTKGSALTHAELDANFTTFQADSGSSRVGFLQDGTGAVARTVQAKDREDVSITDFDGVDSTGTTDSSSGIQACLTAHAGKRIRIPSGTFLASGLTVPADTLLYGDGAASILKKNANGDVLSLGTHAIVESFKIDGEGATYTGRGILVNDSAATISDAWWRRFNTMIIEDTASYCVEFTGDSGGYLSEISGGIMTTYNSAVAAVKFPDVETNGNRRMIGVQTFGTRVAELAAADSTLIMGCEGICPSFTVDTKKARIIGNRFNSGAGITVSGVQSVFAHNVIGDTSFTLSADLISSIVSDNVFASGVTVTDNTVVSSANKLRLHRQFYTPTWSGGSPAIGNGTLEGSYVREGDRCKLRIRLIIGSTTTVGAGAWSFSVPYAAATNSVGQAFVQNASPVAFYPGIVTINSDAASIVAVIAGFTSTYMGSATPLTWDTGDRIDLEIEYTVK
jgi:hypothetical protein